MIDASPGARGTIMLSVNSSWNVVNFRAGLIARLQRAGYAVVVAAPRDAESATISAMGCRYVEVAMQQRGRSPLADGALLLRYLRLIRRERPRAFLGFTAKPNIYGSLAAHICGVPTINNIAGLGSIFNEAGPTAHILRLLYRIALARAARVFFQNAEDEALFVDAGIVRRPLVRRLPGSGVDLARFTVPRGREPGCVRFLLAARLLREKGVAEFAEAGRLLHRKGVPCDLRILGFTESGNAAFVQLAQLAGWSEEGIVTYLGDTRDVRPFLADSDCVVLPSYYREGTPRILLEAAAMGRPIITTDMPGCRDAVVNEESGLIVPPRDVEALALAMTRIAELPADARGGMGQAGRLKAEAEFDERIVADHYLNALGDLID